MRASYDALVGLFERIETVFKPLGDYTQVSFTTEMAEVFVKITAEVVSILSIATREVTRWRASESCLRLVFSLSYLVRNICQGPIGKDGYRGRIQDTR